MKKVEKLHDQRGTNKNIHICRENKHCVTYATSSVVHTMMTWGNGCGGGGGGGKHQLRF